VQVFTILLGFAENLFPEMDFASLDSRSLRDCALVSTI